MATDRGNQIPAARRLKLPGIVPVELWDLELPGGILWELQERPDFPTLLLEALEGLRRGTLVCRYSTPPLSGCRDFARVVLTGGAARDLPASTFPCQVLPGGAGGPARTLAAALGEGVWVLDVGQSTFKLAAGAAYFASPRNNASLPIRQPGTEARAIDGSQVDPAQQRRRLRDALFGLLAAAQQRLERPSLLVLALPCELGESALPGGSSYIGMARDAALADDLAHAAGAPALVLNDAELAAWAVGEGVAVGAEKVLVVTLGFAVGGAILEPAAPGNGRRDFLARSRFMP